MAKTCGAPAPGCGGDFSALPPSRRSCHRRGALLLISLVMLALFLLLGTTFLISASQFRPRTIGATLSQATSAAARDVARNAPLAGGPKLDVGGSIGNPKDAINRPLVIEATRREAVNSYTDSSLLLDKYGSKFDLFQLESITEIANQPSTPAVRFFVLDLSPASSPDPHGGPYEGRIVSVECDDRNAAFRIVAQLPTGVARTVRVVAHQLNPAVSLDLAAVSAQSPACILGREFSGDPAQPGELNEAYDAPDRRNRFLTWEQAEAILGPNQIPDPATESATNPRDAPARAERFVIPAYHRPDRLLAALKAALTKSGTFDYRDAWLDYGNLASNPAARTLLLLRPAGKMEFAGANEGVDWTRYGFSTPPAFQTVDPTRPGYQPAEHPDFTGSNVQIVNGQRRYFDPINGPWDVDNDGDGVADSVWIDIGAPAVTIDGVLCRPLVAAKIVDLDSRLNVNVHGSLVEREFGSSRLVANPDGAYGVRYAGTDPAADTPAATSASLSRGIGWGAAEVDLAHLFEATLPRDLPADQARQRAVEILRRLLVGTATANVQDFLTPGGVSVPSLSAEGRYGDSRNGEVGLAPAPGLLGVNDVAIDAPQGTTRRFPLFDSNYGASTAGPGSPVDPFGITQVGIDQMGQPLYTRHRSATATRSPWSIDDLDTPYDLSVGRTGPRPGWMYDPDVPRPPDGGPSVFRDNLFNAPQLERVLRLFEQKLDTVSPRLLTLLGPAAEAARLTITAESWDTTAICVPRAVLDPLLSLSDQATATKPSLISWDVQLGLRMDLNRPFGDGRDNDTDAEAVGFGIVDEPGEANDFGMGATEFASQCLTNGRDVDGSGAVDQADAARCRELFARHLFVLGMRTTPTEYWNDLADKQAAYRRAMAQWAVNVVDFRDPDSIMTRFQFDDTFGPTSEDWEVTADSPAVWGCERPEVLLTEVMGWRNIEEKQNDRQTTYRDDASGGLMIELYHPWTSLTDEGLRGDPLPAELMNDPSRRYQRNGVVDLAKVNAAGQPVFQLAVVPDDDDSRDALRDDPTWPGPNDPTGAIVFLGPTGEADEVPFAARNPFAAAAAGSDLTSLAPGQFAVIAGPTDAGGGKYVCPIKGGGNDAGAGVQFELGQFSDSEPVQPFKMTDGLKEEITGLNRSPTQRRTAKALPRDEQSGPVGAVIRVEREGGQPLRMPAKDPGPAQELGAVFKDTRHRVILRRLANPLEAWNEKTNPYVAFDSIVLQEQGVVYGESPAAPEQIKLRSTERGAAQKPGAGKKNLVNNIWRQDDADLDKSMGTPPTYRRVQYCGRRSSDAAVEASFGFLPAELVIPEPGLPEDPNQPVVPPFPLLTWPNRDFASAHEILLVPGESPANLLGRHSHKWPFAHLHFGGAALEDEADQPATPDADLLEARLGILEFLHTPSRFADADLPLSASDCVRLNRDLVARNMKPLFLPPHNYVSPFREPGRVNLNTLSSRAVWEALNGGRPGTAYEDEFRVGGDGKPLPFTKSEDWTLDRANPATANWNLDDDEDSNGNGFLDSNDDRNNDGRRSTGTAMTIASSRRGWELPDVEKPGDLDHPDNAAAIFAGDFDRVLNRAGAKEVPDPDRPGKMIPREWFDRPFGTGWTLAAGSSDYDPGRSLLVRSDPRDPPTPKAGDPPRPPADPPRPRLLFSTDLGTDDPNNPQPAGPPYRDPSRNPAFHFADVIRLSNLVTPRSNVFAVWWTIGFFRIDDNGSLGGEYGLETGDNARHKNFMIIDRSIPVGFTPFGHEGNADETVLSRRFTN